MLLILFICKDIRVSSDRVLATAAGTLDARGPQRGPGENQTALAIEPMIDALRDREPAVQATHRVRRHRSGEREQEQAAKAA